MGKLTFAQELEKAGLTDEFVTRQHNFLISQEKNLSVRAKAIDMYYKLKGAYNVGKSEADTNLEIEAALDRIRKWFPA